MQHWVYNIQGLGQSHSFKHGGSFVVAVLMKKVGMSFVRTVLAVGQLLGAVQRVQV